MAGTAAGSAGELIRTEEEAVKQDDPSTPTRPATNRWTRRGRWLGAALAAVLVAASAFLAFQVDEYRSNSRRDDDRAKAVAAAEHVAVGLVTLKPKSAAEDIEALASLGTGDFAKQLRANLESRVDVFKKNRISSTGEVTGAGLVRLEDDTAEVAVAVKSTVRSPESKRGDDRWYRMSLTLERSDDGEWLVSDVEFVE